MRAFVLVLGIGLAVTVMPVRALVRETVIHEPVPQAEMAEAASAEAPVAPVQANAEIQLAPSAAPEDAVASPVAPAAPAVPEVIASPAPVVEASPAPEAGTKLSRFRRHAAKQP